MKPRQHSYSDKKLEELYRLTLDYFLKETNPVNGLVPDSTHQGAPCSIAPTGFALAAYPIGVERGSITRDDAIRRTLATLRFFWISPQGPEPDATGYKGFLLPLLWRRCVVAVTSSTGFDGQGFRVVGGETLSRNLI